VRRHIGGLSTTGPSGRRFLLACCREGRITGGILPAHRSQAFSEWRVIHSKAKNAIVK
jgi:hypothetical protein